MTGNSLGFRIIQQTTISGRFQRSSTSGNKCNVVNVLEAGYSVFPAFLHFFSSSYARRKPRALDTAINCYECYIRKEKELWGTKQGYIVYSVRSGKSFLRKFWRDRTNTNCMGRVFQAETIAYLKASGKKIKKKIHLPFYLPVYLSVCVYVLHSFHWSYNGDYTHRLKPHARQPMQTLQGDALKPVLCLLAHLTLKGFCWKKLRYLLGRYFWNATGYTVLSQWKEEMFTSLSPQVKSARFERDCLETRACISETYKTGFWIKREKGWSHWFEMAE